jgi:hypothetical protein
MNAWEVALMKDWHLNESIDTVNVGDVIDTGERIRRVESITYPSKGKITLHLKEGPPYEADTDNLIDIYR